MLGWHPMSDHLGVVCAVAPRSDNLAIAIYSGRCIWQPSARYVTARSLSHTTIGYERLVSQRKSRAVLLRASCCISHGPWSRKSRTSIHSSVCEQHYTQRRKWCQWRRDYASHRGESRPRPAKAGRARFGLDRRGSFGIPASAWSNSPSRMAKCRLTLNTVSTHTLDGHDPEDRRADHQGYRDTPPGRALRRRSEDAPRILAALSDDRAFVGA